MRLIDANALIDCFEMRGDSDLGWHLYEVIDEINDAPTAYNIDKVVEDLGEATWQYNPPFNDEPYRMVILSNKAVQIVKRGGIE